MVFFHDPSGGVICYGIMGTTITLPVVVVATVVVLGTKPPCAYSIAYCNSERRKYCTPRSITTLILILFALNNYSS